MNETCPKCSLSILYTFGPSDDEPTGIKYGCGTTAWADGCVLESAPCALRQVAALKAANQEMAHQVNDMDAERKGYLAAIRERNADIVGLRAENQKMHHDWMAEHAELENMKEEREELRTAWAMLHATDYSVSERGRQTLERLLGGKDQSHDG